MDGSKDRYKQKPKMSFFFTKMKWQHVQGTLIIFRTSWQTKLKKTYFQKIALSFNRLPSPGHESLPIAMQLCQLNKNGRTKYKNSTVRSSMTLYTISEIKISAPF